MLPADDEDYLREKGFKWEVHPAPEGAALVLKGVRLAPGKYNRPEADVMILIPNGYPMAGLDMYYVEPRLTLANGACPQNAEVLLERLGRTWQRFSRHLPSGWAPGFDNLASFLRLILNEIQGTG